MIVMKFGGTSTQDASAMKNVAEIVRMHLSKKPVVVISAIAQATNMLEKAGTLAAEGNADEARQVVRHLLERHVDIVNEVIENHTRKSELQKILQRSLNEIEDLVKGITIVQELTPRTLDSLYCYGELLSSRLVSSVLREVGIETVWVDTKDFMVTDENHTRALPMMDVVEKKLKAIVPPLVMEGKVPVTQGFIGITHNGRRTTMGRESSDYSAAIIGAALNADDIQIWTDVDGVLTADPQVVSFPHKIKVLSFEEAYELSYFGAKVLHPNTMLPALEKNIPIHIYNSRRPQGTGTLITRTSNQHQPLVKSIAYKRKIALLTISPKKRYSQFIFWEHLYSILTKYSVQAFLTTTSEYNVALVLEMKENISAIVNDLSEMGTVSLMANKAIVCVVGTNLRGTQDIVQKIFTAVFPQSFSMISFGASASNIGIVVNDEDVFRVVQHIHREFFESKLNNEIFEPLPKQ
jgi:aspartate kinase